MAPAQPGGSLGESSTATVIRIIDGDTIVTDVGKIRLLGIDTPERGQCGFGPATSYAKRLAPPGSQVTLTMAAGHTQDRYGRLLRYVEHDGVDFGGAQIRAGLADARYDSRDGYGAHPKQAQYVTWDAEYPDSYDYPNCPQ
jgi:endonuclease YncB( thermonuclease family)